MCGGSKCALSIYCYCADNTHETGLLLSEKSFFYAFPEENFSPCI